MTSYTAKFIRRRNIGEEAIDDDMLSLFDEINATVPKMLDIFTERLEPENDKENFYGILFEISFIPTDDVQRDRIFSIIDSFITGYSILENYNRADYTEDPYKLFHPQ